MATYRLWPEVLEASLTDPWYAGNVLITLSLPAWVMLSKDKVAKVAVIHPGTVPFIPPPMVTQDLDCNRERMHQQTQQQESQPDQTTQNYKPSQGWLAQAVMPMKKVPSLGARDAHKRAKTPTGESLATDNGCNQLYNTCNCLESLGIKAKVTHWPKRENAITQGGAIAGSMPNLSGGTWRWRDKWRNVRKGRITDWEKWSCISLSSTSLARQKRYPWETWKSMLPRSTSWAL